MWYDVRAMKPHFHIVLAAAVVLAAGVTAVLIATNRHIEPLETVFAYEDGAIEELRSMKSSGTMTAEQAFKWGEQAFELVSKNKYAVGFDPNPPLVYAYLTVAQREAARLSWNAKGEFAGDLGPVSAETLCLFFDEGCVNLREAAGFDPYSLHLADIVIERVKERIARDSAGLKNAEAKTGPEYWTDAKPSGLNTGSRLPWIVDGYASYRPAEPPAGEALDPQAALTKAARDAADEEQKLKIVFWAGGPGTKTGTGTWLEFADRHMREKGTDLKTVLDARAIMAMAMADATAAVFDAKYAYWTKRPYMIDTSIVPLMPTPRSPSYPSGEATFSAAAATVLGSYFPENAAGWDASAQEAANSRLWSGIHFPIDLESGAAMGRAIGLEALKRLKDR